MAARRAMHIIPVIASKAQIFENIAAVFAFEFINGHIYDPPDL
jgi:hypothetical protein